MEGGLLHRTEDNGTTYVPAAPSENIEARDVIKLFLGHETIPTVGGQFSAQVIQAAEKAIPSDAFPLVEQPQKSAPPGHEENDEKAL